MIDRLIWEQAPSVDYIIKNSLRVKEAFLASDFTVQASH